MVPLGPSVDGQMENGGSMVAEKPTIGGLKMCHGL
jgi:hypothetical protein